MEGLEKGLFPSKSTKNPKFAPTDMEENNENDSSQDNMNPKYCKKTVAKHFMSPTISASSKAAAPRKKILAERFENPTKFDPQNHKMSYPDWNKSTRNRADVFSPEDDGDSNAYDPQKNFLSPRPKYLRFNPNRRREIFKRLEREEIDCSLESEDFSESSADEIKDSSFSSPEESVVETKTHEAIVDDDDEEEEEEEEEEREWCLWGVLKFLLTLIACLLSTSYICSMNSSTIEKTILDVGDGGSLVFKNQTFEFYPMEMQENGFFVVGVGDDYDEVEEGGIEESFEEAKIVVDDAENLEGHEKESVDRKDGTDTAVGFEGERVSGFEFGVGNLEQSTATTSYESVDAIEPFDMVLNENVNKIEGAETEIIAGGELDSETRDFVESIASRTEEIGDVSDFVMAMEIEGSNQLQEIELSEEPTSEETQNESEMVDQLTDSGDEDDEIEYGTEVETEKTWDTPVVIGVIVVSILSASLAIAYRSKKGRITPRKETNPTRKPHKFVMEEKVTQIVTPIEKKVEFFARPRVSSSYPPMEEEINRHIQAPSAKLLGEIVVGNVSSRFNNSEKYQMTETEINATVEYSTTSSPSHGSFTTERKRRSKKEGEAQAGVTPVRRSSRLRSRAAVTSP